MLWMSYFAPKAMIGTFHRNSPMQCLPITILVNSDASRPEQYPPLLQSAVMSRVFPLLPSFAPSSEAPVGRSLAPVLAGMHAT